MPQQPAHYSAVSFYRKPADAARSAAGAGRAARTSFVRRTGDRSQLVRRSAQWAFLLLNLWIGAQFYLFVRYYENGGRGLEVPRPAGVEGWLPIAALMNLKQLVATGVVPDIHPAGLVLLVAFVAISVVFRKAFCSWLCPIGTISEWLWQGGRDLFGRNVTVARWADIPLRSLKYVLLGLFAFAVVSMSASDIASFMRTPYGLIADVKMLNFFRTLGTTAAAVVAALVVLSVLVKNFWCRYLCPYGALMGLAALFSPVRIRRNADACIDCGKCARACPSLLPVDRLASVRSAECTGCLECTAVCPAAGALHLGPTHRRALPTWAVAAGILAIFLGMVGLARLTGHWDSAIPAESYLELVPAADQFGHPGR